MARKKYSVPCNLDLPRSKGVCEEVNEASTTSGDGLVEVDIVQSKVENSCVAETIQFAQASDQISLDKGDEQGSGFVCASSVGIPPNRTRRDSCEEGEGAGLRKSMDACKEVGSGGPGMGAKQMGSLASRVNEHSEWRGLFGGASRASKLTYYPPVVEDGEVVISPPQEVIEEGCEVWKNCVVGQFVDKDPSYFQVKYMVVNQWRRFGRVEVMSNEEGLWLFRLGSEKDCEEVLESCWHVNGRPLFLRKWEPKIQPLKFKLDSLPLWVKLRNVPTEYWTVKGLSYLASGVGIPLQLDKHTENRTRLKYARVCVEVNLKKPLVEKIVLKLSKEERAEVMVEYSWKPRVCAKCDMAGHVEAHCNSREVWVAKPGLDAKGVDLTEHTSGKVNVSSNYGDEARTKARLPGQARRLDAGKEDELDVEEGELRNPHSGSKPFTKGRKTNVISMKRIEEEGSTPTNNRFVPLGTDEDNISGAIIDLVTKNKTKPKDRGKAVTIPPLA